VGDSHRLIIGEIHGEAVSDLLWAPRLAPAAVCAAVVTAADPAHLWARHGAAIGSLDLAGEMVLDVLPQIVVGGELRSLGTLGTPLGVPLRGRRAVLKLAAARGGIAAKLARSSTQNGPANARSLAHHPRGHGESRSLPVERMTGNAPTGPE